jgi:peptide/nickel transport system permease protein
MKLLQYVLQRFATFLAVLLIGLTITFFIPRFMPGDPINSYISQIQSRAGQTLSPEAVQQMRDSLAELYGLKGSLFSQYVNFLNRVLLHFDFGPSFTNYPEKVSTILFRALPYTAGLLLTATVIAWSLGNLIGLISGFYNKRAWATVLELAAIMLYPIPYYILAISLLIALAFWIPIFPLSPTFLPGTMNWQQFKLILYNSVLPALTLVMAGFGWYVLSMKALTVATKEEPYVEFARLKGVSNWNRMMGYVFRNAALPQVTALVLSLGAVFSGALLTEMIFSYPGVGQLMRTAAGAGDYNLLYGAITLSIIAVATAGFVLDLVYPLFDPRIRLGR